MAEAVAAVALAGNVLQFLEAAGKFVTRAFKILQHGANHSPTGLTDIQQICGDLEGLLERLSGGGDAGQKVALAPLVSLSESCSEVVQELVEKLSRIGVDNNIKRAGLLVAEFKAIWRRREIEELENRIARLRDQLGAHLLVVLR
jgi:hypothetical protein